MRRRRPGHGDDRRADELTRRRMRHRPPAPAASAATPCRTPWVPWRHGAPRPEGASGAAGSLLRRHRLAWPATAAAARPRPRPQRAGEVRSGEVRGRRRARARPDAAAQGGEEVPHRAGGVHRRAAAVRARASPPAGGAAERLRHDADDRHRELDGTRPPARRRLSARDQHGLCGAARGGRPCRRLRGRGSCGRVLRSVRGSALGRGCDHRDAARSARSARARVGRRRRRADPDRDPQRLSDVHRRQLHRPRRPRHLADLRRRPRRPDRRVVQHARGSQGVARRRRWTAVHLTRRTPTARDPDEVALFGVGTPGLSTRFPPLRT